MSVFKLMLAVSVVALAGAYILYVSINYKKLAWVQGGARAVLDTKLGYVFYNSMGVGTLVLALVILNFGMKKLYSEDTGYSGNTAVDTREGIWDGNNRYILPDVSGIPIDTVYSKMEQVLEYVLSDTQRLYPQLSKAMADKNKWMLLIVADEYVMRMRKAFKNDADIGEFIVGLINGLVTLNEQGRITQHQMTSMGIFYELCGRMVLTGYGG